MRIIDLIEQYPVAITIAIVAVLAAFVFRLLCDRGVIPEPFASRGLMIAAAIATLGLLPLARLIFGGSSASNPKKESPKIVEVVAPTEEETKSTDLRVEKAREKGTRAREKLDEIDAEERKSRDRADDPGAGSIARERLRRLQGESE